jgi:hypothetical protein
MTLSFFVLEQFFEVMMEHSFMCVALYYSLVGLTNANSYPAHHPTHYVSKKYNHPIKLAQTRECYACSMGILHVISMLKGHESLVIAQMQFREYNKDP